MGPNRAQLVDLTIVGLASPGAVGLIVGLGSLLLLWATGAVASVRGEARAAGA